jgi:hypothetical protein
MKHPGLPELRAVDTSCCELVGRKLVPVRELHLALVITIPVEQKKPQPTGNNFTYTFLPTFSEMPVIHLSSPFAQSLLFVPLYIKVTRALPL